MTSTPTQVAVPVDAAAAAEVALSADERTNLDGLAARLGVHGDRYNAEHMAYVNR